MYDEESAATLPVKVDEATLSPDELEFYYDEKVRKIWHKQEEEWYFSIIDVCETLTGTDNPRRYWSDLKRKLKSEGANEVYEKIVQLKMIAPDGKKRLTDVATAEQLFRLIQSIPSPKAEPFKQWLARVGAERLDEYADPEKAIDRGLSYYREKGYSEDWIKQRIQSKSFREELTDEWKRSGIETSKEFATLTNILTRTWSGKTVQAYKEFKGLHKENLRDNMTSLELTLNQLAEVSATAISKAKNPSGFSESRSIAVEGGTIAKNARRELEQRLGHSVISPLNASSPTELDVKLDNEQ